MTSSTDKTLKSLQNVNKKCMYFKRKLVQNRNEKSYLHLYQFSVCSVLDYNKNIP